MDQLVRPSRSEVEAAFRTIIRWAGENPDRDGLVETPSRMTAPSAAAEIVQVKISDLVPEHGHEGCHEQPGDHDYKPDWCYDD